MPLDMAMARRFFDEMDTDKSGTIRKCEVYIFLTKKQNKSKEEAIGVLGEVFKCDKDDDGVVTWEEFKEGLQNA